MRKADLYYFCFGFKQSEVEFVSRIAITQIYLHKIDEDISLFKNQDYMAIFLSFTEKGLFSY